VPPSACRFGQTGSGKTYTMKSLEGTPGHSQSKARPGHSFLFHPQTHDVSASDPMRDSVAADAVEGSLCRLAASVAHELYESLPRGGRVNLSFVELAGA
jgi:hypothetical protein